MRRACRQYTHLAFDCKHNLVRSLAPHVHNICSEEILEEELDQIRHIAKLWLSGMFYP